MKSFYLKIFFFILSFQPTVSFSENEIIPPEEELPAEYEVKRGDTLSDICEELFSNRHCWKKFLSLNPSIKNPNLIQPGLKIKFYPSLQKTLKKDEELPLVEQKNSAPKPNDAEQLVMTLFNHDKHEAITRTDIISKEDLSSSQESNFLESGATFNTQSKSIVVPGFIFKEKKSSLCNVTLNVNDSLFTSEHEDFFCNSEKKSSLQDNQNYTALRFIAEVSYKEKKFGYFYQFVGQVKITKRMNKKDIVFLGKVSEPRIVLEKDDIIIPYISAKKTLFRKEGPLNMTMSAGSILLFDHIDQTLGGEGHFVFLSKGKKQGVKDGETLSVYKKSDYQMSEEKNISHTIPIGKVKILDSQEMYSLGIITSNEKEVSIGDEVGLSK